MYLYGMKRFRITTIVMLSALVLPACTKSGTDDPGKEKKDDQPTLVMSVTDLSVSFESQARTFSIKTNSAWVAASSADWVTLNPSSGSGSDKLQDIEITIHENKEADRTAQITVTAAGKLSKSFSVQQARFDDGIPTIDIKAFKSKPVDSSTWYRMTGIVASIANYSYGNFYIVDDTGYLYVYGLTAEKTSENDQSFQEIGLKVGDTVTFVTHRSKYNDIDEAGGTIPAYYEKHIKGSYSGIKASSAPAKWLELPETSASDGFDFLAHYLYDGNNPTDNRSYSYYWDYHNLVARWAAYPMYSNAKGSGTRTDAWALDPLLDPDKQPNLTKVSYHNEAGVFATYTRGHVVPSADRLSRRNNLEVFFGTNITPQHDALNAGIWADLEGKIRGWSYACDTLYVVTGSDCTGSTMVRYDNDGKEVTVPSGLYKALLLYSKADESYIGFAAYFKNDANSSELLTRETPELMSIDKLEEKLGFNFFVNLPEDIQTKVEAENPKDNDWWWTH